MRKLFLHLTIDAPKTYIRRGGLPKVSGPKVAKLLHRNYEPGPDTIVYLWFGEGGLRGN